MPATAVLIPTTRPRPSASAPPELPGFSAASVWITFSTRRPRAARRQRAAERGNDAGGHRPGEAQRVADRDDQLARPAARRRRRARRRPGRPPAVADHREVGERVRADHLGVEAAPVRKRGPDARAGAVHDVRRGEQVAVGGDHDAGAAALRAAAPGAAFDPEVRDRGPEALGHGRHGARVGVERLGVRQLARLGRRLRRRRATVDQAQSGHETEGSNPRSGG